MSDARIQVLYILGTGHSGSTLLNLLLGAAEDTIALGEVKYTEWLMPQPPPGADPASLSCDCGHHPSTCALWGPALRELPPGASSPFDDLELFERLARATGRRRFVDSSKSLPRLDHLLDLPLDVKVIHLIRDPRGIAAGHIRRGQRHWLDVGLRWAWANSLAQLRLARRGADVVRVRYDDLARHPEAVLGRLNQRWGLRVPTGRLTEAVRATSYHNFSGNTMRHQEFHGVQEDDAWRRELPPVPRAVLTALSAVPLRTIWRRQGG